MRIGNAAQGRGGVRSANAVRGGRSRPPRRKKEKNLLPAALLQIAAWRLAPSEPQRPPSLRLQRDRRETPLFSAAPGGSSRKVAFAGGSACRARRQNTREGMLRVRRDVPGRTMTAARLSTHAAGAVRLLQVPNTCAYNSALVWKIPFLVLMNQRNTCR